jgi:transposase
MGKYDARKLSTDAQQEIRYQVIRLKKNGYKRSAISEITGVHPGTISKWCTLYKTGGKKALKIKKRGRPEGSCRTLSKDQEKRIQKALIDKCPDQMKLPFALWTRIAVQQYMSELHKIEMPIRTVGQYLSRWNFTPQKPLKRAYKQNPEAVMNWLKEQYPSIKKRALMEQAEIQWADETGLCNDRYYDRSYAPKGQTPATRSHPRCQPVNLISSITNQGKVRFMFYKDKMNSQIFINFMKRLIKDAGKKVFLILENLKDHRSYVVKNWLKEHQDEIEVFFLPS